MQDGYAAGDPVDGNSRSIEFFAKRRDEIAEILVHMPPIEDPVTQT